MHTSPGTKISITVLITCYREGDMILTAVDSLKEQTDQDFELLVVNDLSPDDRTNEICRELESGKVARVIWRKENGGLSGARNTGFEEMSGDVCICLDADDVLSPNVISDTRRTFEQHPDAAFICGDYIKKIMSTSEESRMSLKSLANPDGSIDPKALVNNWIMLGTSPCRKSAWQKANGYSSDFRNEMNDMDFFMRMLMKDLKGYYTGTVMYIWQKWPGSMSSNVTLAHKYKLWTKNLDVFDRFGDKALIRNKIVECYIVNFDYENARKYALEFKGYISPSNRLKVSMLRYTGLFRFLKGILQSVRRRNKSIA